MALEFGFINYNQNDFNNSYRRRNTAFYLLCPGPKTYNVCQELNTCTLAGLCSTVVRPVRVRVHTV